jgi:hypothetical protein
MPCARLPSIYTRPHWAQGGDLVSCGADATDNARRAGIFTDKILKGAKRGDMPLEQPTHYYVVTNRKTANTRGPRLANKLLTCAYKMVGRNTLWLFLHRSAIQRYNMPQHRQGLDRRPVKNHQHDFRLDYFPQDGADTYARALRYRPIVDGYGLHEFEFLSYFEIEHGHPRKLMSEKLYARADYRR